MKMLTMKKLYSKTFGCHRRVARMERSPPRLGDQREVYWLNNGAWEKGLLNP
jgi:hypothetical protein